jgi:hypothetical protein
VFISLKENVMKRFIGMLFGFALLVLASPVFAADAGSISITSPANGATIPGGGNKLAFNVHLGPNGNHVHIYVDDQNPIVFRDVSHCPCSIDLPELAPGKHTIVVKEATSSHAMTGVQASVTATVK